MVRISASYLRPSDDLTNMDNLIKRNGVCDEVVLKLQQQICSGQLKEGDKLPSEPALMKQFGVGRSSIREAIKILANTGLVRVKQGSGTFVQIQNGTPTPWYQRLQSSNSTDLNEVRQLLEFKIVEKAALNRTEYDIQILTEYLKKRKEAAEKSLVAECIEADIQFHLAIADSCKNEILTDLYKNIAAQIKKSFRQAYTNTEIFILKHSLHEDLLKSIIDKDAVKALACVELITK